MDFYAQRTLAEDRMKEVHAAVTDARKAPLLQQMYRRMSALVVRFGRGTKGPYPGSVTTHGVASNRPG